MVDGVGLDSWEGGGQVVNTTMVLWFAEMGEGDKQQMWFWEGSTGLIGVFINKRGRVDWACVCVWACVGFME